MGECRERKRRKEKKRKRERKKIFGEPVKERRRFGEEEGREKKSSVLCFSLSLCIFFSLADVVSFDWVL